MGGVDHLLLDSIDGLLLLRDIVTGAEQYLVCNPAARQWSNLSRLCSNAHHRESDFYFHEPSEEYRLLCHVTLYPSLGLPPELGYYVFSTGADEPQRLNAQATPVWNAIVTSLRNDLRLEFYHWWKKGLQSRFVKPISPGCSNRA
jgi:hypothetical protein